jgi:hypothetical protein
MHTGSYPTSTRFEIAMKIAHIATDAVKLHIIEDPTAIIIFFDKLRGILPFLK